MKGADETMSMFQNTFRKLQEQAEASLQHVPRLNACHEASIPEKVASIRRQVLERFPDMSKDLLRVAIGAIQFIVYD